MRSSQTDLRLIARAFLDNGEVNAKTHSRMSVRLGTGKHHCSLCQVTISQRDVECAITVEGDVYPPTFRFHAACHRAWFDECADSPQESLPVTSPAGRVRER